MPYPGPRRVKVEREFTLVPTGELSSFFVWRPHYVGNNEPVYLGPKDADKWKVELAASLAAMVALVIHPLNGCGSCARSHLGLGPVLD